MEVVSLISLLLLSIVVCLLHKTAYTWGFLYSLWLWCDSIVVMNEINTNRKAYTFLWDLGVRRFERKRNQFYFKKYLVLKWISQYPKSDHYGTYPWCAALLSFICSIWQLFSSCSGILRFLLCLFFMNGIPVLYLTKIACCQKDKELVRASVLLSGVKGCNLFPAVLTRKAISITLITLMVQSFISLERHQCL